MATPRQFEVAAFQVVTEIAEMRSAAESIGWPMKDRFASLVVRVPRIGHAAEPRRAALACAPRGVGQLRGSPVADAHGA
jgi:hypothetical protein